MRRPLIIQYFLSTQLAGPYFIWAAHGQKQEFRGALKRNENGGLNGGYPHCFSRCYMIIAE